MSTNKTISPNTNATPTSNIEKKAKTIHWVMIGLLVGNMSGLAQADDFFRFRSMRESPEGRNWQEFSANVHRETEDDRSEGIAYIITGSLGLVGGAIGYYSSHDPFAKAAFSLTESIGIAGIGYGAFQFQLGSHDREFENIIANSKSLTPQQRDEILANYLAERNRRRDGSNDILRLTYGAIAVANLANATHETDPTLRTALYVLSAFNALGVLRLTF